VPGLADIPQRERDKDIHNPPYKEQYNIKPFLLVFRYLSNLFIYFSYKLDHFCVVFIWKKLDKLEVWGYNACPNMRFERFGDVRFDKRKGL